MSPPPIPPSKPTDIALANPGGYAEAGARRLRPWLARLVAALAPEAASFGVRFTGDRAIRRLNRDFRGIDRATDVLSFPGGPTPEGRHLGDVVVSVDPSKIRLNVRGPERPVPP